METNLHSHIEPLHQISLQRRVKPAEERFSLKSLAHPREGTKSNDLLAHRPTNKNTFNDEQ